MITFTIKHTERRMKHIHHHIFSMVGHLLSLMLLALLVAGCQQDYSIDTVSSAYSTAPKPDPGVTDEVVQLLSAIPGVSNITVQDSKLEERRGYYFFVEQLVDNTDASKGTFKQRCFLEYAGAEAPVMLYSHGYHIEDKIDNVLHHDIAQYLGANSLIVEHRYFGKSLPEDFNDTKFTYLYTSQASADLHRIVTLFKQHLFTKGNKWVCTGGSKSGGVATIYAYHSDLYGWDDIDLYMPFCAPFLTGTSESAGDKSVGIYLANVCGSGYPEGSNEANAYQSLRAYPSAIANNKLLREACMRRFYEKNPESYIDIIKAYPNDTERALTAAIIYNFYVFLLDKFAVYSYSRWCGDVPNPTELNDESAPDDIDYVADFVFLSGADLIPPFFTRNSLQSRSAYTEADIIRHRAAVADMPYELQSYREIGVPFFDFSLVTGNYVTPAYCEQVCQSTLGPVAKYDGLYHGQWDGGKIMKAVRQWVNTTKKNLFFVYGSNDPWTSGAIDIQDGKPNLTKIVIPGGCHSDDFLSPDSCPEEYSALIKQALDKYIKGSS